MSPAGRPVAQAVHVPHRDSWSATSESTSSLDHLVLVDDSLVVDASILGVLLGAAVVLVVATRGRLSLGHRAAPAADSVAHVGPVAGC
jgi:hypothetical protein